MAYLGRQPVLGNFVKLDAITVVNGQAAYTMQNGGVNFTDYTTVNQFLVSLNGTIQAATDSFTVSGSTITFASNLSTGDVIDFIIVFGNSLSAGTVSDSAITTAKLGANSVTAAKLNNDIISGTTALTSEPADTDEFLVSDAGTLKRIDYSLIKGGGITEADQWRLTSSITSDTDPISANLERVDDATFSKIGTGMSVVNGHWIFPSTGLWQVFGNANIETAAVDNVYLKIEASTDGGSAYDSLVQFQQSDSVATYGGHAGGHVFVNVTNTSTYRVKFLCGSLGGSGAGINGNTNFNFTYFTFIRLGDSQ